MECGRLLARGIPQLRLNRVENGMTHFMADDIGAFPRKDRPPSRTASMKKIQCVPIVECIEVHALVEHHRKCIARLPRFHRKQRGPKIGTTAQRFCCRPVAELRRARIMMARRWCWPGK